MAGIDFQVLPVADDVGRDMHELIRENELSFLKVSLAEGEHTSVALAERSSLPHTQ